MEAGCHTNYNELFHSEKNHFAPKGGKVDYSWIIKVCLAIIKHNHNTNYIVIFRNFFDAAPPKKANCQSLVNIKLAKAAYDRSRRSDPKYKADEGKRRNFRGSSQEIGNEEPHVPEAKIKRKKKKFQNLTKRKFFQI